MEYQVAGVVIAKFISLVIHGEQPPSAICRTFSLPTILEIQVMLGVA